MIGFANADSRREARRDAHLRRGDARHSTTMPRSACAVGCSTCGSGRTRRDSRIASAQTSLDSGLAIRVLRATSLPEARLRRSRWDLQFPLGIACRLLELGIAALHEPPTLEMRSDIRVPLRSPQRDTGSDSVGSVSGCSDGRRLARPGPGGWYVRGLHTRSRSTAAVLRIALANPLARVPAWPVFSTPESGRRAVALGSARLRA